MDFTLKKQTLNRTALIVWGTSSIYTQRVGDTRSQKMNKYY